MKSFLYLILTLAISYCCGNLNGSIIASRSCYQSDVRECGSGNAGLTNFCRCYGVRMAFLVILIDILKTVVAVFAGGIIMDRCGLSSLGQGAALLGAMIGHMFPVAYQFRGGKGVLTAFSGLIIIDWRVSLMMLAVFAIVTLLSRYVSLGSVICAGLFPFALCVDTQDLFLSAFALVCSAMILIMHRDNIRRLCSGTESKLTLFGRKNQQ